MNAISQTDIKNQLVFVNDVHDTLKRLVSSQPQESAVRRISMDVI